MHEKIFFELDMLCEIDFPQCENLYKPSVFIIFLTFTVIPFMFVYKSNAYHSYVIIDRRLYPVMSIHYNLNNLPAS